MTYRSDMLVYHLHVPSKSHLFATWAASPVKIDHKPGRVWLGFRGSAIIRMDLEDAQAMAREILKIKPCECDKKSCSCETSGCFTISQEGGIRCTNCHCNDITDLTELGR